MNRRTLLKLAATSSLLATAIPPTRSSADPASVLTGTTRRRVRPSDPSWPSLAEWEGLNQAVGGRLVKVESPLAACADTPLLSGWIEYYGRYAPSALSPMLR